MKTRFIQLVSMTLMTGFLSACISENDYKPVGRWEATEQVEVYEQNDHPLVLAFRLDKGEVCSISNKMLIRKDLGYAQVSCHKGSGWVISGAFKQLND